MFFFHFLVFTFPTFLFFSYFPYYLYHSHDNPHSPPFSSNSLYFLPISFPIFLFYFLPSIFSSPTFSFIFSFSPLFPFIFFIRHLIFFFLFVSLTRGRLSPLSMTSLSVAPLPTIVLSDADSHSPSDHIFFSLSLLSYPSSSTTIFYHNHYPSIFIQDDCYYCGYPLIASFFST